jgi:hypothetical protein
VTGKINSYDAEFFGQLIGKAIVEPNIQRLEKPVQQNNSAAFSGVGIADTRTTAYHSFEQAVAFGIYGFCFAGA